MLRELRIRDFAIIDDLTITFRPGLNVITGETGAGKSILIQALGLLCGGRATPEVVRDQTEAASIEGVFDIPGERENFAAYGIEPDDELIVRRVIPRTGKGRVYLNGSPATVAMLSQVGTRLVHLYGQHDQALLLHPASHLDFLDEFGIPRDGGIGLCCLQRRQAVTMDKDEEAAQGDDAQGDGTP